MQQNDSPTLKYVQEVLALILQSITLRHENQWEEALACLDEALIIQPKFAPCFVSRAEILAHLERFNEAVESLESYLQLAPASPEIVDFKHALLDEALNTIQQGLNQQPDCADLLLQRASLYERTAQYDKALADYMSILKRYPTHADAHNAQGNLYFTLNRYLEAMNAYTLATACEPERAEFWYNLGNVLQFSGHLQEARANYQQALRLAPDFSEAQLEIAHCWLREAEYAMGWPLFDWRWRTQQLKAHYLATDQPLWLAGKTPLAAHQGRAVLEADELQGKVLLIWAEQGLGDTLQFVRFVPELLTFTQQIIVRVQQPLVSLLQSMDERIYFMGDAEPIPNHDVHCPLMSLPFILETHQLSTIPPYIHADEIQKQHWKYLLGEKTKLRVGIAWAGRQYGMLNPTRDMPLTLLCPLASLPVEFFQLQKEIPECDKAALATWKNFRSCSTLLYDFSDTAALIENLDLVICVDTAIAHLAGAMGKPCWLMLRYSSEWRWQQERTTSPWYDSLTLFRQPAPGRWEDVALEIAVELSVLVLEQLGHD